MLHSPKLRIAPQLALSRVERWLNPQQWLAAARNWTQRFRPVRVGSRGRTVASIVFVCALALSCRDDVVAPKVSPEVAPSYVLLDGTTVTTRDVPELTMDLPPAPRPWDQSDSALVEAVRTANNRAFVAFKNAESPRVGETPRMERQEAWRPEVIVKKGTRAGVRGTSAHAGLTVLKARGASVISYYDAIAVAYVNIEPSLAGELRSHPLFDYIEPALAKYELAVASPTFLTAPTKASSLDEIVPWGISAVRAPQAWSLSTGSGARLLIIDTGHQQDHEDLAGVSSSNCFGTEGGCDDAFPVPHGTWVSGVALSRDNALGVVGVAPGVSGNDVYYWGACNNFLPGFGGGCHEEDISAALNWAAGNLGPLGVINLSLGSPTPSLGISNAVAGAWAAGHVIIAAAGNNASNTTFYPAAYSNVVGVSGLNQDLSFAAQGTTASVCNGGYSNYGEHVDLSGPFDVLTTQPTSSYGYVCGTSFATPHVAGAALTVRAANPSMNNGEVVGQLLYTAQDLGAPAYDIYTGRGIIRTDLAAGLYSVSLTASLVSQHPQLTWTSVPLATQYRIYRRIFRDGVGSDYELWSTTTGTTFTDIMFASSFFGYNTWPATGTAVNYHVTAVSSGGFESSWGTDATFIPIGEPPG